MKSDQQRTIDYMKALIIQERLDRAKSLKSARARLLAGLTVVTGHVLWI